MLFRNKKLVLIRILKLLSPMPSKKRPMQSNPFKIIKMPKRSSDCFRMTFPLHHTDSQGNRITERIGHFVTGQ